MRSVTNRTVSEIGSGRNLAILADAAEIRLRPQSYSVDIYKFGKGFQ